jgi:hypothetical protein
MIPSKALLGVSWLVAGLAVVAALGGLLWREEGEEFAYTSVRGRAVEVYGEGLYRYDSLFVAAGNRGTDIVTLFLGIPLLALSILLYKRGSLRGHLLLTGTLAYFLYVYSSYALGATAFNELFFIYAALFAASVYGFLLAFSSIDLKGLAAHFSAKLPRRGPAVFMLISGVVTLAVWASPILSSQMQGETPERLDHYSTMFTAALDLAVITPATFIAGMLILRRVAVGYVIALSLLVLEAMLAPLIIAQTISQVSAGESFSAGQIVGPIAGFSALAMIAVWIIFGLLRNIGEVETKTVGG